MLKLYEAELDSRLLLGTSRHPSPAVLMEAVKHRAAAVTVRCAANRAEDGRGRRSGPCS